jgi:hypothetical protein
MNRHSELCGKIRLAVPAALPLAVRARAAVPGLVLAGIGAGLLVLARSQPLWLGQSVGPGLFAHALALGVAVLGLAHAAACAFFPRPSGPAGCGSDHAGGAAPAGWLAGPALLGAVLAFALLVPVLGLVMAAGVAAGLAARAAGERRARPLATTVAGLMGLVAVVGLLLLPSTAPLWPQLARG